VIGIVIVSHSAKLAEGVLELAREMAGADVKLVAAGGMALPGRPLGTDPVLVAQAMEQVYSPEGVLVLMDLGSAVLSAEMALELVAPEHRGQIRLCEAPLVEGALSAAVQARLGGTLEQALAEARGALAAKAEHLQAEAAAPCGLGEVDTGAKVLRLMVANRLGLHARPAARMVLTAGRFREARLWVRNLSSGRGPVPATSINGIATLGLGCGQTMEISASGAQAEAALAALQALAEDRFGEAEGAPGVVAGPPEPGPWAPPAPPGASGLAGLIAARGLALGPARKPQCRVPSIPQHRIEDPQAEWATLLAALDRTRAQIQASRAQVARRAGPMAAAIFEAHLLFLDDGALREPARRLIFEQKHNAADAWQRATEAIAGQYSSLADPYLRGRAADVIAVGRQVIGHLLGAAAGLAPLAEPGILIARDLTPADTADLDPATVLAICTALGGPSSHSAILARSLGIPALVGLGEGLLGIPEGTPLIVDAEQGRLLVEPVPETVAAFLRRREERGAAAARARLQRQAPALTLDGRRMAIGANIGCLADAHAAVAAGAEGVGLLRTEFLFLNRATAPDEEEQYESLCAIARVMDGRPVIVRTLDAGGDKPLKYLDCGQEANPFLGWRAIRLCLAQPDFFKVQLRAIVRAAAQFPVRVMFPMIATLAELRAAKALLAQARDEVARRGAPVPDRLETGIMVEIPAAAVRAGQFAPEVDFFSIGSNDLTQYAMAAERGNPRVASLADPLHPAVLDLVRTVADAAHAHGKWVGLCGELGGDPQALPLLVGLGLDELSMAAPAIAEIKQGIRRLDYPAARALALRALGLDSAEAVRAAMGQGV
jgi:phosphocarrier protein FPr